jgi:parallel beta-helix repeat protein
LNKIILLIITLIFLIPSIIPNIIGNRILTNNIIYVDDIPGRGLNNPPEDYTNIQDAVDAANNGDTIFVYTGIYCENIKILKRLSLTGEDKDNTILDGGNVGDVIRIVADSVVISGFTIQHGADYGLELYDCSDVTITGNNICDNNGGGIQIYYASKTTVSGNIFEDNSYDGVEVRLSSRTIVIDNTIKGNLRGCLLLGGSFNKFIKNNFIKNKWQVYFESDFLDFNGWYGNYWHRWISIFPRPIFGRIHYGYYIWIKYDLNPARQPYIIN